MLDKGSTLQPL
jgi:hypothetical protein